MSGDDVRAHECHAGRNRRDPSVYLAPYPRAVSDDGQQRGKNSTFVPSPAADALVQRVEALLPWQDVAAVRRMLAAWSTEYTGSSIDELRAHDVAEHLALIGRSTDLPGADDAAAIAFFMLGNVARGREAAEYDLLRDTVKGWPARTLRHYRHLHGGIDGLGRFLEHRVQYELDLAALVRGGRKVAAARRWLERHPGMHAKDAPPPRPGRS